MVEQAFLAATKLLENAGRFALLPDGAKVKATVSIGFAASVHAERQGPFPCSRTI
jgi:hypothetical protein